MAATMAVKVIGSTAGDAYETLAVRFMVTNLLGLAGEHLDAFIKPQPVEPDNARWQVGKLTPER
jgi:hypothetical protein